MDFLKIIALPQSAEHIQLLHYLLIILLFIFITFISMIFSGTWLTIYFKKKERIELDNNFKKLAKDLIELVTVNKNVGLIFGLMPLLTVIIIFSQLLQASDSSGLIYLGVSFILLTISLNYIYDFMHSFRYMVDVDLNAGKVGLTFLFFALWFFVTGLTSAVFYSDWQSSGLFGDLFSWRVLVRLIFFFIASFTITGGALLFGIFYLDDGKRNDDEEYGKFVRSIALRITFISAIFIPFFMLINLFMMPENSLSAAVFSFIVIGLLTLFISYNFLYMIFARFQSKYTALLFFTILFMVLSVIISDQSVMSNSTKVQSATLANQYEEMLMELKGLSGPAELNGEEIYNIRCVSCHKFDVKLVGPPHNKVVPKYFGKEEELIAFIRNPVKVDPEYPPMPNPGLKPAEAKAVADYLLENVKSNQ
ncbi:MAG: c-type cytochrome [Ignavibacteriaceae bacterium]